MILIVAMLIILYFLMNTIILLVWSMDGFMTKHKFLEAVAFLFFGFPILVVVLVASIVSVVITGGFNER